MKGSIRVTHYEGRATYASMFEMFRCKRHHRQQKYTNILLVVEKKNILWPNEDQIYMYKCMSTACIYYQRM